MYPVSYYKPFKLKRTDVFLLNADWSRLYLIWFLGDRRWEAGEQKWAGSNPVIHSAPRFAPQLGRPFLLSQQCHSQQGVTAHDSTCTLFPRHSASSSLKHLRDRSFMLSLPQVRTHALHCVHCVQVSSIPDPTVSLTSSILSPLPPPPLPPDKNERKKQANLIFALKLIYIFNKQPSTTEHILKISLTLR